MTNLSNHNTLLKIMLGYAALLPLASLLLVAYLGLRILFPPQIPDQTNNPQLQNLNQALDLVTNQTSSD